MTQHRRGNAMRGESLVAVAIGVMSAGAIAGGGDGILYVDAAAPGGDGSSWAAAMPSLQDALDVARRSGGVITELRVATGIYRPDQGESQTTGDRSASFELVPDLSVRGSFAGVAGVDPDEQDLLRFPSVLDGDLLGDDGPDGTGRLDNALHVVTGGGASMRTRLERVVIRGGNADGSFPDDRGGGVFLAALQTPRLVECVIEENRARLGGGLSVASNAWFEAVLVQDNHAGVAGGGAHLAGDGSVWEGGRFLANTAAIGAGVFADGSTASLDGTEFTSNVADFEGGGLAADGGGLTLIGCRITRNVSGGDGGGVSLAGSHSTLTSCKFVENAADRGGGARLLGDTSSLAACTFLDNTAVRDGGGLAGVSGAISLVSCPFTGNAAAAGGGLAQTGGTITVAGGRFNGNDAVTGGGVDAVDAVSVFLACTFSGNEAGSLGGGLHLDGGTGTVDGCVFDENFVEALFVNNGGGLYVQDDATVTLHASVFLANRAQFGGGLGGSASVIDATGCTWTGNSAGTGGGIYAQDCQTTLLTGIFRDNVAEESPTSDGGAIATLGGSLTMRHGAVEGNASDFDGGGVHLEGTDGAVADTTFLGNIAGRFGGGLSVALGTAAVVRGSFLGNQAPFGGGLFGFAAQMQLRDSVCAGNHATGVQVDGRCVTPGAGGGAGGAGGSWTIVNGTIAGNIAACDGTGGGLSQIIGDVANSILWGNEDGGGRDESAQVHGGAPMLSHSCVEGWTGGLGGAGNVGSDPQFRDPAGPDRVAGTGDDDVRLAAGSPLVDAGANDAVTTTLDRDGRARRVDDLDTIDTGTGRPPLVDMGAYETQTSAACAGDVDQSGDVGFGDLVTVLGSWGACRDPGVCPGDVDDDGVVGLLDLLRILAAWGACP